MLIINSQKKMKGQVFQKQECVCLEHEKLSPGVNGISICTNKYLKALDLQVRPELYAHVTRDADLLKSKANSIFLGNMP